MLSLLDAGAGSLDASDLLAMMGVAECRLGSGEGLKHAQEAKDLRIQLGQLNNPHGAYVLQQLGVCYFMLGDFQAALDEFAAWPLAFSFSSGGFPHNIGVQNA